MAATDEEIRLAGSRFVAWLRWYYDTHEEQVPSQEALADAIGVSGAMVSTWLSGKAPPRPGLPVLLGFYRLVKPDRWTLDAVLFSDPPALPPGWVHRE